MSARILPDHRTGTSSDRRRPVLHVRLGQPAPYQPDPKSAVAFDALSFLQDEFPRLPSRAGWGRRRCKLYDDRLRNRSIHATREHRTRRRARGAMATEPALPGSRSPDHRPELRPVPPQSCGDREDRARFSLERGTGVVRRRALPVVERHPQQPDHEVGGRNRRRKHFSPPFQFRQWQHARPPGPARHVRAWRAPRYAHRVRRHDLGHCGRF